MENGESGMGSPGAAHGMGDWVLPFQFALFALKSSPYLSEEHRLHTDSLSTTQGQGLSTPNLGTSGCAELK